MADRYWVGGTGNWSDDTNHWATSSGGLPGAGNKPTSSDNAIFDSLSNATAYTVTIDAISNCANFTLGAPLSGKVTWTGSTGLNVYGSVNLSGGTAGITRTFVGTLTLASTSTGKTITLNGILLGGVVTFDGVGGGWTLQDSFNTNRNTLNLTNGTLDTNGVAVTIGQLNLNNSNTKVLTLGATTLDINTAIFVATGTTINAGTSSVLMSGAGSSLNLVGLSFYDLTINSFSNPFTFTSGGGSLHNLSLLDSSAPTVSFADNVTCSNTLTITGGSATSRTYVNSSSSGTARTLTAATVSLTDVDFTDITGAGAASPFTGTRLGNAAGNSGITFTTPANKYYVGNTGVWNGLVWALTSGGVAAVNNWPLPQDTAVFDSNSFSANSQTVTLGAFRVGSVDFSAMTNRSSITWALGTQQASFYGNVTLTTATSFAMSGNAVPLFVGRTTQNITSNGVSWVCTPTVATTGTVFRLVDNFTLSTSRTFTLDSGALDLNGKILSVGLFDTNTANVRSITSSSGSITLTGTGTIWAVAGATNLALNDALQVNVTTNTASARTINHGATSGGTEANAPSFNISAGSGTVTTTTSGKIKNLVFSGSFTGTWTPGTQTIYGGLTLLAGMTAVTAANTAITFAATSGTYTVTSGGLTVDKAVTFNGTGGTWQLGDDCTLGTTSGANRIVTLTAGTLDLNGHVLTTVRFSSSGSTARTLKSSAVSGKLKVNDTAAATTFDMGTSTSATIDRTNAWTIEVAGNTTNTRTFAGGGLTLPAVSFSNTTASGRLNFTGSNTFTGLTVSTPPQTIGFTAGTTTTVESNQFPSGTAGNLVTIASITAAGHTLTKTGGDHISADYLSISRSTATPSSPKTWFAGPLAHSTDGGNNSGWNFITAGMEFDTGAAAGSYATTGVAATVRATRTVNAGAGSYATSGAAATLRVGRLVSATAGSYATTGVLVGIHRAVNAAAGVYTINGYPVADFNVELIADPGVYAVTGNAATLLAARRVPALAGSYAVTGAVATLRGARLINAAAGSYAVTGSTATLLAARLLSLTAGSYAMTGAVAALLHGYKLNAAAGSYATSGAAATLLAARLLNAALGVYAVTGNAATLRAARLLSMTAGSYAVTGSVATLRAAHSINAAAGSYTTTGAAAALLAARLINAGPGVYAVTGATARLLYAHMLNAAAGSYATSGAAASLLAARLISPAPGSYAITGDPATFLFSRVLSAAPGAYALTGDVTSLLAARRLTASPGAYALTGNAATLHADHLLAALAGSYAVSGNAATLRAGRLLSAGPGAYALTGNAAILARTAIVFNAAAGVYTLSGSPVPAINRQLDAQPGAYVIVGDDATFTVSLPAIILSLAGTWHISPQLTEFEPLTLSAEWDVAPQETDFAVPARTTEWQPTPRLVALI